MLDNYKSKLRKSIMFILSMITVLFIIGCKNVEPYEYTTMEFLDITYILITNYNLNEKNVVIPDYIEGKEVRYIGANAFWGRNMETLDLGNVREIQEYAFRFNKKLVDINFGSKLTFISSFAFESLFAIEEIRFPESLNHIGLGAFTNNPKLRRVYFKGNPDRIDRFLDDNDITIYGIPGGTVEAYAIEQGYTFIPYYGEE